LIDRMMQPGMPFRRHLGPLRLALVDDPAALAAEAGAAQPLRLVALQPVVAVAVGVAADRRAAQPGQQPCSERRAHAAIPSFARRGLSHRDRAAVKGCVSKSTNWVKKGFYAH